MKKSLSHIAPDGTARMVDVSGKAAIAREAIATGRIQMTRAALRTATSGVNRKGDPVQTARLAGIMAAKRTASLIPLCHPLQLSHVNVDITPRANGFAITASVRTTGPTGVEMEALTAVSVAALTLYDMIKAVDKSMEIGGIRLLEKRGGKSGAYVARARRTSARRP
jgi:cyclic pyranopterin phosphate synthase